MRTIVSLQHDYVTGITQQVWSFAVVFLASIMWATWVMDQLKRTAYQLISQSVSSELKSVLG